ncbi:tRNA (mnm(5)s(2)U34)-methyltransferase, chloroplastic isoform X1 [Nicotiana tomentosiformis]|uniref:rRNA methylase YtqB isoform X1 n=1 Tax=Nicotiana tabacum TaxID=4097 RepID=A0A1S4D9Z1_TOBAC|nr:putative rRNA methylase YtqB isoform X1 [Nicotiana tomentosiformis]XP_009593122.1 putative rRNA methylase YtqB isoform X1 [Nicotiana tomentosiformis]XP_009593123.1 putative rRNA methylase YtqB isoform X1 [Nicotiana tomentosiformis]XP_016510265.1 PREDICTED: putative rRNA methylase YtqB isoform X1 [Nicotiana tabacum]XP_016510266.1 PREDICTED: putative rRNA methylase YtqB isoform X1 [Nicotiana tabacum]XP_016510268.1 PREDICTED: putative rRNA methylase YtqB isoform X1 [Nicotiana tabacum]XP_03351
MNLFYSYSSLLGRRMVKCEWNLKHYICPSLSPLKTNCRNITVFAKSSESNGASISVAGADGSWSSSVSRESPISGSMEQVMVEYVFGRKKATEVAHYVWKQVVQKGDAVVDATCGNGYDTLALLRMVADNAGRGRVYGMDVQKIALESTSSLLDQFASQDEKELVELFVMCHSQMEDIVPNDVAVRLVAFNLGYLPGGDKKLITRSETTVLALEAAKRLLAPGGLISIVTYVGHPGGREEFEKIEGFASGLPVESWNCCKLQLLNRPLAPILIFLFKR